MTLPTHVENNGGSSHLVPNSFRSWWQRRSTRNGSTLEQSSTRQEMRRASSDIQVTNSNQTIYSGPSLPSYSRSNQITSSLSQPTQADHLAYTTHDGNIRRPGVPAHQLSLPPQFSDPLNSHQNPLENFPQLAVASQSTDRQNSGHDLQSHQQQPQRDVPPTTVPLSEASRPPDYALSDPQRPAMGPGPGASRTDTSLSKLSTSLGPESALDIGSGPVTRSGTLGTSTYLPSVPASQSTRNNFHSGNALLTTTTENQDIGKTLSKLTKKQKYLCWSTLVMVVISIIISAVVGAVVSAREHSKENTSSASSPTGTTSMVSPIVSPTADPTTINAGLPGKDLQVDTAITPIAFVGNASSFGQSPGLQYYGVWYQNVCGNVKGVQNSASWVPYGTAFTDSTNISGLAGADFFNETINYRQTYLFYIGVDGHIRDKKLNPINNTFEVGSLLQQKIPVIPAPLSALDADPSSGTSDAYALEAVSSENWADVGVGVRLFHHASNSSGNFIQEHVWSRDQDSWTTGAVIGFNDVLPVSKLKAVVDEQGGVARLMYASAGDNSTDADDSPRLQEWYLPLRNGSSGSSGSSSSSSPSSAPPVWTRGQTFAGLLQHGSSAFALASTRGTSFLYYVHVAAQQQQQGQQQISELTLPDAGSGAAIDLGAAQTVAVPDWQAADTAGRAPTLYAPLAAVGSDHDGSDDGSDDDDGGGAVTVFWAEGVVDTLAGYDRLVASRRPAGRSWPPASYGRAPGQFRIPVDTDCVKPVVR